MGIYELTPWDVADRLFEADDGVEYPPAIEWLSTWRSRIGLLFIIYFGLSRGFWPFDYIDILTNWFAAAFFASFVVLAAVGLRLLCASRPISESMKHDCKAVVRRVGWFYGSLLIMGLVLLVPGLNVVAAFWEIPFLWCALWLLFRQLFGAGQVDPLLAPLVTAATIGLLALYNLSEIRSSKIPPHIDELIIVSGFGTTALVSLAEFTALCWRRRHEVAMPDAPTVSGDWTTPPTTYRPGRQTYRPRRRFPGKMAIFAVSLAILVVLSISLYGAARHFGTSHGVTQSPGNGSPANSAQGTLTIRSGHDYVLAIGEPYQVARVGGADVGDLTGTPSGVDIYEAYALPLPASAQSSEASCLALDWTGKGLQTTGQVIPWSQLKHGSRICVQTTYSGLWISLLTVKDRGHDQATFQVVTWSCDARPDESAIC